MHNMKVFIVTKEGFPNGMAATNRIKCYARALHDGGMDCEVLVCGSTEIQGVVRNTEANGVYEGISYHYIGGTTSDYHSKPIRRLLQLYRYHQTEKYLKRHINRGDAVLLYLGQRVKLIIRLIKLIQKQGGYCVTDLCEYPYGARNEKQTIALRNMVFNKQFPLLNGIISISDSLLNLAKSKTSEKCHHVKVPIMVEYEHYYIEKNPDKNTIPYIFHAGTLSEQKDGILGMIEAFGIAKNELQIPIKYILTGSIDTSPQASEIRCLINKYHIEDSVVFVGYLFRDQINNYLRNASLVISNRPKSIQDYYGFSTKVGEYLASGTPLITTRWGEVVNWLVDGETAYVVEPENVRALADTIIRVFNTPEESRRIGQEGQEVCKKCFDYRNWSKILVDYFHHLSE